MQLVTVAEAAKRLAVHPDTIRNLINRNELQAVRVGRAVRIEETELERLVARQRPRRRPPAPAAAKLTTGQQRALHAKAGDIDHRSEQPRGTAKREALAAASEFFGREITSSRDLTEDEASWTLDWLEETLESQLS